MPTVNVYDVGDLVILHSEITISGLAVTATGEFTVKVPGEPIRVVVTAAEGPQGTFEGTYEVTKSGRHYYRFIASGAQQGEEEKWFDVREVA